MPVGLTPQAELAPRLPWALRVEACGVTGRVAVSQGGCAEELRDTPHCECFEQLSLFSACW